MAKLNLLMVFVLALVILCSFASAWNTNTFNNSLTGENLTLTPNVNVIRYLAVPQNTYLSKAYFNLSYGVSLLYGQWNGSLSNGLVSYFKMNETAGQRNDSLGRYNLTVAGGTTAGTDGIIGNYFASDGGTDGYTSGILGNTQNITIGLWVRRVGSWVLNINFLSMAGGDIELKDTDCAQTKDDFSILLNGNCAGVGSAVISDGNWHYIFITATSNKNTIMYVDNVLKTNASAGAFTNLNGGNLYLFAATNGLGIAPTGRGIDEFAIWNRTLNDSERTMLYNAGHGDTYSVNLISNYSNATFSISGIPIFSQSVSNTTVYTNTVKINNINSIINNGLLNNIYSCISSFCYIPFNFNATANATIQYDNLYAENAPAVVNYENYDNSTYETASETFAINATGMTTATFNYAGTAYPTSVSNGYASQTIDIPIIGSGGTNNNTFYWNMNGGAVNSTMHNQTVFNVNLSICNPSSNVPYVNFTFMDENSLVNVNGSTNLATFNYYLGGGGIFKTLLYTNVTTNPSFAFCFFPSDKTLSASIDFQYSGTGYPQREYSLANVSLTNATTNQTLYLLASAEGIYSTFIINTPIPTPLSGADVQAYRTINGVPVLIAQGVSGSDGGVTFWLNPNFLHTIIISRAGYLTQTLNIKPTQTIYSVLMSPNSGNATFTEYLAGATWSYFPAQQVLLPNTVYTFGLNMNYSLGGLVSCRLSLTNGSGYELTTASGCSSYGGTVSLSYNTGNLSLILLHTYINTGKGEVILDPNLYWISQTNSSSWGTIKNFFSELNQINNEFGGDQMKQSFTKVMLYFFLLVICLSALNLFTNIEFTSPTIIMLLIYGSILFGSVAGFFTIPYTPDTTSSTFIWTGWVQKYFIAGLSTLFTAAFFMNMWRKETT